MDCINRLRAFERKGVEDGFVEFGFAPLEDRESAMSFLMFRHMRYTPGSTGVMALLSLIIFVNMFVQV